MAQTQPTKLPLTVRESGETRLNAMQVDTELAESAEDSIAERHDLMNEIESPEAALSRKADFCNMDLNTRIDFTEAVTGYTATSFESSLQKGDPNPTMTIIFKDGEGHSHRLEISVTISENDVDKLGVQLIGEDNMTEGRIDRLYYLAAFSKCLREWDKHSHEQLGLAANVAAFPTRTEEEMGKAEILGGEYSKEIRGYLEEGNVTTAHSRISEMLSPGEVNKILITQTISLDLIRKDINKNYGFVSLTNNAPIRKRSLKRTGLFTETEQKALDFAISQMTSDKKSSSFSLLIPQGQYLVNDRHRMGVSTGGVNSVHEFTFNN